MTPAERLRAAADTIERTAGGAHPGPWRVAGRYNDEVLSDTAAPSESEIELYGAAVVGESMTAGSSAHVALWDPPTALLVAPILQFEAHVAEAAGMAYTDSYALELADHILTGGAS